MTKVTIVLTDTEDGLVSAITTVEGYNANSNAQALASRLNEVMGEICEKQQADVQVYRHENPPQLVLAQG